ncbi:28S ribosomal protein S6, mitochondrial [Carlito syrichta]|uniref:Small ribosomal subunit protein bS6m n=1 Tax=Carlito syrichta TaxID=1868482 RepID=A0A3Q0DDM7_CARSF|nr:28S ribosomal protein S6, mitochondrial [Carlito syrichta]
MVLLSIGKHYITIVRCFRRGNLNSLRESFLQQRTSQPETAAALKRTIEALMDRGAIVRDLENLGERALPYKISTHSQRHSRGGYFLVDFYAPTTTVESMMEHLSRDVDVIRPNIVKHPLTQDVKECEGIVPVPLEEKLYSTKKRKK